MASASSLPRLLKVVKPLMYSLLTSSPPDWSAYHRHPSRTTIGLPGHTHWPNFVVGRSYGLFFSRYINQGSTIFVRYCRCLPTYHCLPDSTILFLALHHLTRYVYFTFADITTNQIFNVRLVPVRRGHERVRQRIRLWRRRLVAHYSGS